MVIVHEAHRSISPADAAEVTGLPLLASVPVTDRVARIVDVGLLGARSDGPARASSAPSARGAVPLPCWMKAGGGRPADR